MSGVECGSCTFLNPVGAVSCEVCGHRLSLPPAGSWTCEACTFLNTNTLATKCELCRSVVATAKTFVEAARPKLTLVGRVNPLLSRPPPFMDTSESSSEQSSSSDSSSISSESENEEELEHPSENKEPEEISVLELEIEEGVLPFVQLTGEWNFVHLRALGKAIEKDTCLRSLFLIGENNNNNSGSDNNNSLSSSRAFPSSEAETAEELISSTLSRSGSRLKLSPGEILFLFNNELLPSELAFVLSESVGDYARIALGMAFSRHKHLTSVGIHHVRMGHATSKYFSKALATNTTLESLVVSTVDFSVGSYMKYFLVGALACRSLKYCKFYFMSGTRSDSVLKLLQKENLVSFSIRPFLPLTIEKISPCLLYCELTPERGKQSTDVIRNVHALVEENIQTVSSLKAACAIYLGPYLASIMMDFLYAAWPAMLQCAKTHGFHL